ncbi:MAG: ATP-binding cassette domain-containing protein, partial [Bacillota bacterium]
MASVELRAVSKRFGPLVAVDSLSLNVAQGEVVCILGAPGAGKTTTLRMIAGLERPDSGAILFDGRPVDGVPPQERDVGMVFEDLALYPHLTGFRNISHPLRLRKLAPEEIRRRVHDVARLLEIEHLLERLPHTFSGGERQRVAFARAVVRRPAVLLLDEPLSNLDAKVREAMRAEIVRLQETLRQTTIMATHDYEEAMAIGARVAV